MAPSAADRARKMEMRQEAAAVAAATSAAIAAATALVASSTDRSQENNDTATRDAASTMLDLSTSDAPAKVGSGNAAAPAASQVTPRTRGKGKGKGRASHLGPSFAIAKTSRSATPSPVGVMSAGLEATPSSNATPMASRPPAYLLATAPQFVGQATTPYAHRPRVTPLYSSTATPQAVPNSTTPTDNMAEAAAATAAEGPLGARRATAAGFVVRTSPNVGAVAASHVARTKGAISGASPVVAGVRRRTHRIPAARLARQLKAAEATAAANRLNLAGDTADSSFKSSSDSTAVPAAGLGLNSTSLAAAASAAQVSRAPASGMATGDRMEVDKATNVIGDAGAGGANESFLGVAAGGGAPGSGPSTAADPPTASAGWVDTMSAADVSDARSAPPSTPGAPSAGGSTGGVSTPGPSDIESGSPSPSRPLMWRSTRAIPSPSYRSRCRRRRLLLLFRTPNWVIRRRGRPRSLRPPSVRPPPTCASMWPRCAHALRTRPLGSSSS